MKRLFTLLTLLGACLYAGAQKKAVAVIEAYDAAFTLQSAVTGTLHVRYTVTVQDKAGLREAAVYIYTDTFASLGSFSGEIVSATGEKTKLSRKDLTSVAYSSGLVDDGFLHAYAPSQATRLPLTVTYDYTLQYKKGVISFPAFAPLDGAGVQLKRASCSIEVPEGTQIIQYAAHVKAHDPVTEKKRTVYRWEAGPVGPFADEEMAPPAFERIPLVLAAPVDFSYAGTKGTQSGWKEYGAWLYSLQEGADSLPDELTARLQEMTRDCKTPLEKLKVDSLGLDDVDIRYLRGIIERFRGGPVGVEAIASAIGEEAITLEDVNEPYLLQIGFINRTARGRMVTEKAYRHLNIDFEQKLF